MKKTLGIIPARGGSKRLPGKNIKDFLGKPLIAWTIEVAKESGVFERLVVLTDDESIAAVARRYGAEVPYMEPRELAGDTAYISDALRWVLEQLASTDHYQPEYFILLEPSAVGRESRHVKEVVEIMEEHPHFDSLLGVSEVPGHWSHLKQYTLKEDGALARVGDGIAPKYITHRNQDVEKSYAANSAVYAFRRKNLFEGDKNLWGECTYGYVMDGSNVADIDTMEDWMIAEVKITRTVGKL